MIKLWLRSEDGLEWEDTGFPFKNNDSQTEATMCADSAGNIHLCFEDNWRHTGYCVYSGGSWGRITQLSRFPERVLFDTQDQLLINSKGDIFEQITPEDGFAVIPGQNPLFPGFHSLLQGKQIGDNFSVSLPCEKAFGKYEPALVMKETKSLFPEHKRNPDVCQKFQIQEDDTWRIYRIIAVDSEHITLDGNHELAGQDISIDIGIVDIRPATPEELKFELYNNSENIYPDEIEEKSMDTANYFSEWKRIAASPDLYNALREHFAFLAVSDESKELLLEICDKATQVSINDTLLVIEFEDGFTMRCYPPFEGTLDECIPESCRRVAMHHNTISLEGHDVPLIFAGPNSSGELADSVFADITYTSELEESVKIAIYAHQDEIVYSPFDKTAKGEPSLNYISHETCAISDKFDGGVDEIFLLLMAADILDREIPMPLLAKPEIVIAAKTISLFKTTLDLSDSGLSSLSPEIGLLKELNLSEDAGYDYLGINGCCTYPVLHF
jgi:FKBP-type peptidyl-prolyl cis-trans isomerase SlyD